MKAYGVASEPPLLGQLSIRLKAMVSQERFVVAGNPDYILHRATDSPHRVVLTLHVQSRLHQRLFSIRNWFLQATGLRYHPVDYRTEFHLSVDNVPTLREEQLRILLLTRLLRQVA